MYLCHRVMLFYFNLNDFMLISKCVKCIICKVITIDKYDNKYSVAKVDYRGAAAPKNVNYTDNLKN